MPPLRSPPDDARHDGAEAPDAGGAPRADGRLVRLRRHRAVHGGVVRQRDERHAVDSHRRHGPDHGPVARRRGRHRAGTGTESTATTPPRPIEAPTDEPTTVTAPPSPTGVPGIDAADGFCAAWARYGATVQIIAVAVNFGELDDLDAATLELQSAPTLVGRRPSSPTAGRPSSPRARRRPSTSTSGRSPGGRRRPPTRSPPPASTVPGST